MYSTGVSTPGTLLADGAVDPHYQLVSSADPSYPGPNAVVVNSGVFPMPPWLANGGSSKWLAPRADQNGSHPPGTYTYRTTFDLTGFNPATVVLTGRWATDNTGIMKLNGTQVSTSSTFDAWRTFTVSSGFVAGVNPL